MNNNVLYVQLSNFRNPQCYPDIKVAVCHYIATVIENPKYRQKVNVVRLQNPMQISMATRILTILKQKSTIFAV